MTPNSSKIPHPDRTRLLSEAPVGKLLLSFSLPAITGMLVSSLYVVIDRAFLGHAVGADAIAGLTFCMPVAFVIMAVGTLIGVGSGALVSIRLGQRKLDEAELILGNAVAMTLVASVTLTAILLLALDWLLSAFGATALALPYARQFLRIILLGSFFQHTSFGLNAIIRAEGNPRLAMMTQLCNAVLNVALDAVLIFGFKLGVSGAAVATVISQAVAALWTFAHFRSSRSVLKLRLRNIRLNGTVARPALAIGLAPFTMQLAASVVSLLVNRALARHGGDVAISAYGVIGALAMMLLMPVFGLSQGAQPIIGFNYGAGRMDRVRATLFRAIVAATSLLGIGFVIAQSFPAALARCFLREPHIVTVAARGLRICLAAMPVVGYQVVSAQFFQAIGKARTALLLALLRQVVLLIPLIILLPRVMGLDGLWAAGPIADTAAAIVTSLALVLQLRAPATSKPTAESSEATGAADVEA